MRLRLQAPNSAHGRKNSASNKRHVSDPLLSIDGHKMGTRRAPSAGAGAMIARRYVSSTSRRRAAQQMMTAVVSGKRPPLISATRLQTLQPTGKASSTERKHLHTIQQGRTTSNPRSLKTAPSSKSKKQQDSPPLSMGFQAEPKEAETLAQRLLMDIARKYKVME